MGHKETHRADQFANEAELSPADAAPSLASRVATRAGPSSLSPSERSRGARLSAAMTRAAAPNETMDGLTSSEEAIRRGAEDTAIGAPDREIEDLPLFDRAHALPKI